MSTRNTLRLQKEIPEEHHFYLQEKFARHTLNRNLKSQEEQYLILIELVVFICIYMCVCVWMGGWQACMRTCMSVCVYNNLPNG